MGQKVNPYGMRIGITKGWKSSWFATGKTYIENLHEDLALRRAIRKLPVFNSADIADLEIIRHPQRVTLIIFTSRPGVLIGVKGSNIEKLTANLSKYTKQKLLVKIRLVNKPEANAQLLAAYIARQLKMRSAWRRTLKMAMANCMRAGVLGVKIRVAGRLGGAEMTQNKLVKSGRIPLHTFRANIDYGFTEAFTIYGTMGVKVWIYKGEVTAKEIKLDAGKLVKASEGSSDLEI